MKPRCLLVRAHSIASSTEPPHSPPTPIPWMKRRTVRMTAPQMPIDVVGRHEADERRSRCPSAAGSRSASPCGRCDRRNGRRSPRRSGARRSRRNRSRTPPARRPAGRIREEELAEDEPGDDAVEEEVVPLDGGADRAGDDGAAQLAAMHVFGNAPDAMSATAMAPPPLFGRSVGRRSPARRNQQIVAASRGVGKEGG